MPDPRIERERQKALSGVLDRVAPFVADGSAALLVTTTTVTTYPSTAAAFYASNPTEIDGSEVEGGAALTPRTRRRSSTPSTSARRSRRSARGSWHMRSGDDGCSDMTGELNPRTLYAASRTKRVTCLLPYSFEIQKL